MSTTRSCWPNGILTFYDRSTHERVLPLAPVVFMDDFLGKAIDTTTIWTLLDTAGGAEALVADAPNGAVGLTLTNAVEVQLAGLSWGDNRTLTLNQGLVAEFRARFTTLPVNASTAVIGLAGDHNADIDVVAESAWFRWDASGAVTVENDDTAAGHQTSKVATGVTVLANIWHIYRIDCTDIASVKFYIDGDHVAAGTTFNMSQVAALALQPVARMDKAADALNLGVMEVDYVRCWQKRS